MIVVRPPDNIVAPRGELVSEPGLRRSERQKHMGEPMGRAMLANLEEPQTLEEALASEDRKHWYEAWESEVDSLVRNKTWVLTTLPKRRETIGCRWLFKRKEDG